MKEIFFFLLVVIFFKIACWFPLMWAHSLKDTKLKMLNNTLFLEMLIKHSFLR